MPLNEDGWLAECLVGIKTERWSQWKGAGPVVVLLGDPVWFDGFVQDSINRDGEAGHFAKGKIGVPLMRKAFDDLALP